jgi:hypothetical protein
MKVSDVFEQQVHRIYELLMDSGAVVTWNDHITDPDNPTQRRQIDVTIRRDGKLTLIECRQQKSRQDVQWIEELIGRRTSLGADAVFAVSASGFTKGALKKAARHAIVTRDLHKLTDSEIKSWGLQVAFTLFFYQYSDLEVSLLFERESVPRLDQNAVRSELNSYPGIQSLFNAAAKQLGTLNLLSGEHAGRTVNFGLRLQLAGFRLSGEPVLEVDFRGKARLIPKEISSPAVLAYGEPGRGSVQREAMLEVFALGATCITHDENRISVLLDISQLEMPPFCQFRFFKLSGGEQEMDHQALEFYGLDKLRDSGEELKVNICSM